MTYISVRGRRYGNQGENWTSQIQNVITQKCALFMLSRVWMTIDGIWIRNWIYWPVTDRWLQEIITVSLIHTHCSSLQNALSLFCIVLSSPVVARKRLPTAGVPLSLVSRTTPVPQLPISNRNSPQRLDFNSFINECSPTNSLHPIILKRTALTVLVITSRYGRHSSVALSIVACTAIDADRAENTASQPVHWRAGHSLDAAAISLFLSLSLPINGSIRHNMYISIFFYVVNIWRNILRPRKETTRKNKT
jgi:hypothetical protein